jgi:hypothetical protein
MPPAGEGDVEGHEAICMLNVSDQSADVTLTFYFEDREPEAVTGLSCGARRTRHIRLDRSDELAGYVLPEETPYALVLESTAPLTVQHTRVDTRTPALALMTTMAVPGASTS